jgi:hypothetical protein
MSSLARENISQAWIGTLQALPTLLQNPWCCVSLVVCAAVACFLSTGLLWPAAAILSSLLTTIVQGYLEKHNQQQHLHSAHSESLMGPQLGTCDENVYGNAIGESIADRASVVTASASAIVTCASEDSVEQSSVSMGEPSVVTSLDHVYISLKRSESEDWGFAWQVGAYGAKRLILVNIGASSPMRSCNASREAHGQPTIASGDELVCVDTHTEFGAMQKALDSATSLELTFLKARSVKPVLLSAVRREKKRLSIERNRVAFSLVEVTDRAVNESCQKEKRADSSAATSNTIMREAMPFDAVVTTKNTFVNFRTAESGHMERFAHSDPTPMCCMSPTLFSNDDQSDEAETMSADNLSAILDDSDGSSDSYTHFDTMDVQEFVKEMTKEDRSSSLEVQCVEGVEASSSRHFDTIELQQQTSFPEIVPYETEIPHFDTIGLDGFKEEARLFEDRPLLSHVQFADESTPHSDSIEFPDTLEPLQSKAKKKPILLANLLMEPEQVETPFLPGTRSSFEQACSLEFHSSHTSCYANNLRNDAQQRLMLPSSQCLGTQPCFTPSWREPTNIFSLMGHEKQPNNNLLAYKHESPLQSHCEENAWKIASCKGPSVPSSETKTNRKTKQTQKSTIIPQVGEDWYCPMCFDLQFRANLKCRRCGLPREYGVTEVEHLDADRFLEGHTVTTHVAARFRSLAPNLQQAVMSGGSLHGARDPTAVLSNRIRKAEALATGSSRESAPIKLGFDRKQKVPMRHFPAGGDPF